MSKKKTDAPKYVNAAPATLGDVIGEQLRAVQAEKKRRAELDAMGFKAPKADR